MGIHSFGTWLTTYAKGAVFPLDLSNFKGRRIAIDALGWLHNYLSTSKKKAIRKDALFINDSTIEFKILCKLTGELVRFLERLWEAGVTPVFFFDGPPHPLKNGELTKRKEKREKLESDITQMYYQEYLVPGSVDRDKLWTKVVQFPHLPTEYIISCQNTLTMLGVPWLVAEHDGEQLAAHCCAEGLVAAVWSGDSDTLVFGSPVVIKGFVTGKPSMVEVVHLGEVLRLSGLTFSQLTDLSILLGCDFNTHINGIGPVKAMELIQQYHTLENVIGYDLTPLNYVAVREIFAHQATNCPQWQLTREHFSKLGEYIYQLIPDINKNSLVTTHQQVPLAQCGYLFQAPSAAASSSSS